MLTGNIAVTGAAVVDSNNQPLSTVNVGQWVYIQTDFTTVNLPGNASYRVATRVNGLTLNSSYITWGAGSSGTGSWDLYWGTFLATPGTNQVSVAVDPDDSVPETTYADNTFSFTFNAVLPAAGSFISYTAAQMRNAYGVNSIPAFGAATPDGSGQTIAIINGGNDPSLFADVDGFDQTMSLTTSSAASIYQSYGAASSFLSVYNQNGVNITANIANSGSNGVPGLPASSEESWDVEWAHAMAPGAKIDEIEFDTTGSLATNVLASYALAAALPGVSAANWSGGLSQWSTESTNDSSVFVTPSGHVGVTFICPSNDNGANVYPSYGQGDGYYPSTSPNVLSVGGTTLTLNNNGYGGETGWSYPTPATTVNVGSTGYSQTGTWSSHVGGFGGTFSTAAAGSSSTATWTIPVSSADTGWGTELSATWTASPGNATNTTYTVYDGTVTGTVLGTIAIDQTRAPAGTADGAAQFQELGVFFPTLSGNGTGILTVVVNARSANGTVVADAIGAAQAWASTGGPAFFESEPAYQVPFQTTGYRTTPDIAFDADFSADGYGGGGVTYGGGGTSLGGPCWTGLMAVINQGRVAAGGEAFNGPTDPTQVLQAIYSLRTADFHDITTGYNGFFASPGYDLVTGRGAPIANLLVPDMVAYDLPISIDGTSSILNGGDKIYLRAETGGSTVDYWVNPTTPFGGTPTGSYPITAIGVSIDGMGGAADALTIDLSNGPVFPAGTNNSIQSSGGEIGITISGNGAAATFSVDASGNLTIGGRSAKILNTDALTYSDGGGNNTVSVAGAIPVTYDPGNGTDTLSIAANAQTVVNLGSSTGHLTIVNNGSLVLNAGSGNAALQFAAAVPESSSPQSDGVICGRIYDDLNANGYRNVGDKGLVGRAVYIDSNHNGKLDPGELKATTSSDGSYTFSGLAAGHYLVREVVPSGWRSAGTNAYDLTLAAGQNRSDKDFAQTQLALISGVVFLDENGNGKQDGGEAALSGFTVYLDTNNDGKLDDGESIFTTGAGGKFSFIVPSGKYHLRIVARTGFAETVPVTGAYAITAGAAQLFSGDNFAQQAS